MSHGWHARRKSLRPIVLSVEMLEDRCVPSASDVTLLNSGALLVKEPWLGGAQQALVPVTLNGASQGDSMPAGMAPVPIGPSGTLIAELPTFSWTSVAGANHYDLWVNDLTANVSQMYRNENVYGTSIQGGPDFWMDGRSYRWWVRAIDAAGNPGDWSASSDFSFSLHGSMPPGSNPPVAGMGGPPTTLAPVGSDWLTEVPTFSWTAVSGASHYDLWIDDLTANVSPSYRNANVAGTWFQPGPGFSTSGHQYRWWVRAVDAAGQPGDWSAAADFALSVYGEKPGVPVAPVPDLGTPAGPIAPGGSVVAENPRFSWSAVSGAAFYVLWIDDVTANVSGSFREGFITGTSFEPGSGDAADGHQYRWWVRAVDPTGHPGDWSAAADYTYSLHGDRPADPVVPPGDLGPPPNPIDEAGTVVDTTVAYSWSAVAGANHYDLWVDDLTANVSPSFRQAEVYGTSFAPANGADLQHHFRWWVRAVDAAGQPGDWSAATDYTYSPDMSRPANPDVPALATPGAISPSSDRIALGNDLLFGTHFSWTDSAGAQRYDFWMDDLTSNASGIYRDTRVASNGLDIKLQDGHQYRWWVRALDAAGQPGDWSAASTFGYYVVASSYFDANGQSFGFSFLTIPSPSDPNGPVPPAVIGPNGDVNSVPTFTWRPVTGVDHYQFWLADLTADRNQLLFVPIIHGTSLRSGSAYSVDGHRYRWWVRGVDSAGVPGPWSAAADFGYFEAATPTNLAVPSDGTINSMPELTWAPVAGATKYDIWADDLTTGAAQVLRDGNVTGSTFTPATPLAQGDAFRYWVRAIDASGVASPWSSPLDFTVSSAAPVPEARTDPVIGATLTLSWSKVPGADHYDVWMDDVTTGQPQVARLKDVADTSVTPSALAGGQCYRWWVRAVDVNGVPGPWSDPADLNYYTIAAPVLVGPTGSTLDSAPTLSWAPVTGATAYDVWVDDVTAGTSQIERNQSVAGTSYTPTTPLPMDHVFRFWVRPIDADHNPGPWSTALDFAVSSLLATTVTGPAGPAPGALVGTTMPTFSWTPVTGADHYDLWIDDLTTGEKEVVRLKDVALTHSTPGIALTNGDTYQVWVRAVNAQRQTGPWSDPFEFTIQPHALAGQGQGTYTVQDTVPDIGVTYILQGVANLAELGDVTVSGSVHGTGFIALGHASGAVTFTNDRGTVTVQLQGPEQAGFSFPPSDWQYQVTSGSGDYENLKDQGSLTLTLEPASATTFGPGNFTLTIAGGQPPQAHSGIEGVAWIGPIFPIDRPGVPNTQPLAGAVISVETADGSAQVARVIADDKGRFDIPLAPGRYHLVPLPPQPGQVWPRGTPQTVDVLADVYTQVTVNYDSGIR